EPREVRLRLRQIEAAFDERSCGDVELFPDARVLAAVGHLDHAPAILGLEAHDVAGHPVLAFLLRERVVVDQNLPIGRAGAITLEAGPAPDPADPGLVLPEVVDKAGVDLAERNA